MEAEELVHSSCATADGPPLLALEVLGGIQLNAVRRDASVLVTPFGDVMYALVSIVYIGPGIYFSKSESKYFRFDGVSKLIKIL